MTSLDRRPTAEVLPPIRCVDHDPPVTVWNVHFRGWSLVPADRKDREIDLRRLTDRPGRGIRAESG